MSGHGVLSKLQKFLGVGKNYFSSNREFSRIPLARILDSLEYLEIDPREFFSSALGQTRALQAKPSPVLRTTRKRLRFLGDSRDVDTLTFTRKDFASLDSVRDRSPAKALRLIQKEIESASLMMIPWLLGCAASAYRVNVKLEEAIGCLNLGMRIAKSNNMYAAIADGLIRSAYVYCDNGEYLQALEKIESSFLFVGLSGAREVDIGLALQERSRILYYLGRHEESIATAEAALPLVEDDPGNFAALQHGLALLLTEKGEFEKALEHLKKGLSAAPKTISNRAGFHWLEARIQRERGGINEACASFNRTIDIYLESSSEYMLGQAALVGVELVDSLFQAGRQREAVQAARALVRISIREGTNPVIGLALLALSDASVGLDGDLITQIDREVRGGIASYLRCSAVRL